MNTPSVFSLPDTAAFIPQFDQNNSTPQILDSAKEGAARLKQLLLDLSRDEQNKDFRAILRDAAASVREKAFGFNRAVTKKRILKLLAEFALCEIDDFLDDLDLPEKEIGEALDDLLKEKKIVEGRRRRWQEAGKHYNRTFGLATGD